jgi:hypothetical protein
VKIYREKGPKGFYTPRATRSPAVLVDGVVVRAEERLAEGASMEEVAEQLNVKLNTLQKVNRAGRIRMPVKKTSRLMGGHGNCRSPVDQEFTVDRNLHGRGQVIRL